MKTIIRLFLTIFAFNVAYAQPTKEMIDLYEGNSFSFKHFVKNNTHLYISDWSDGKRNNEFFILKKKGKNNKNPFKSFHVKKSETDSLFHYYHFIYNGEVMTIVLNNNDLGMKVNIKKIAFKKGVFFIDLKELYKKNSTRKIELDEFPFQFNKVEKAEGTVIRAKLEDVQSLISVEIGKPSQSLYYRQLKTIVC